MINNPTIRTIIHINVEFGNPLLILFSIIPQPTTHPDCHTHRKQYLLIRKKGSQQGYTCLAAFLHRPLKKKGRTATTNRLSGLKLFQQSG